MTLLYVAEIKVKEEPPDMCEPLTSLPDGTIDSKDFLKENLTNGAAAVDPADMVKNKMSAISNHTHPLKDTQNQVQ